jgi:hypothetical protein
MNEILERVLANSFSGIHKSKIIFSVRSIQRRPQMQFSMARKFRLLSLRRYNVKHSKLHNFPFDAPGPE